MQQRFVVETMAMLGIPPVGIERLLDVAEARLAALAPQTALAEPELQELHEIRSLVAGLAADLLGEDHPFVSGITGARVHQRSV
jgi:hypothetical protein